MGMIADLRARAARIDETNASTAADDAAALRAIADVAERVNELSRGGAGGADPTVGEALKTEVQQLLDTAKAQADAQLARIEATLQDGEGRLDAVMDAKIATALEKVTAPGSPAGA